MSNPKFELETAQQEFEILSEAIKKFVTALQDQMIPVMDKLAELLEDLEIPEDD